MAELSPFQFAVLGTKHEAHEIADSAQAAYWLSDRANVACDQHVGWMIDAFDKLAPHIEALRTLRAGKTQAEAA